MSWYSVSHNFFFFATGTSALGCHHAAVDAGTAVAEDLVKKRGSSNRSPQKTLKLSTTNSCRFARKSWKAREIMKAATLLVTALAKKLLRKPSAKLLCSKS